MNYCVQYSDKVALFCSYFDVLVFCQNLKDRGIQYSVSRG